MSSNESPLKSRWEPRNPMSSVLFIFVECRGGVCLTVWEVKKPQDFFWEGWVVVEVWFVVAVLDEIFWSFFVWQQVFFFSNIYFFGIYDFILKKKTAKLAAKLHRSEMVTRNYIDSLKSLVFGPGCEMHNVPNWQSQASFHRSFEVLPLFAGL